MSDLEKIRAAIIGGSQSGKSFLAMGWSRGLWRYHRLRSLVFDPWMREPGTMKWGTQAWVTDNFETWKGVVCSVRGCVAIWDEASSNGGKDEKNTHLFTEIRHRHPALIAIGHSHDSLLRAMRVNLTDLYLANADPVDAMLWARTMKDQDVKQAVGLKQYEFLGKRNYRPVHVLRQSAAQIEAGVLL